MDYTYSYVLRAALLTCCLSASNAAQAETLPWMANLVADPFASEQKASKLVYPDLKPDSCQLPNTNRKLHFNEVVIAALCNNPDTKAAYLSLIEQAATYASNYSSYLPNAAANIARSRTTSFALDSKTSSVQSAYGVSLSMLLYDFGQREFKLETAELSLFAAGHSYNATLQALISSSMQGYYSLLTAQYGVDVAKESERYARESYDAAKLRHKIGQVPLADELQAEGAYSQSLLTDESAQNTLALEKAALALLMGLPAATPIQVADIDKKSLAKDPFQDKIEVLINEAKLKRPDLLATRETLKAAEESLLALKRSDLATISATTNMDVGNNGPHLLNYSSTHDQAIGITVSIPIFTGFSQTYSERAAEKSLEAQRNELTKSELGVEQDVWNAWHNYETAKQSWKTSQVLFTSAVQLKDVALGSYKEGLGSILDVLNAESQYSSALQSQLQARYNLLTTRVALVDAVGVLDLNSMHPDTSFTANVGIASNAHEETR